MGHILERSTNNIGNALHPQHGRSSHAFVTETFTRVTTNRCLQVKSVRTPVAISAGKRAASLRPTGRPC
eukprot:893856-Lingulodinium_polyedra.AAC.1